MALTKGQEKLLANFAQKNKHWPKDQLELALWRVRWELQALDHQREPDNGEYDTMLMLAGRGAGKTYTASNWIGLRAALNNGTRWLVTAPTSNDIRATCFEGDSGLMNIIPPVLIDTYNKSLFEIHLKNGSIIQGIPGSEPERYRGKQFHGAWFDELAAFDYLDDAWDQAQFTLRLRDARIPRVQQIVTTTPKPRELIVDLNEGKVGGDVYVINASSYDNRANLSKSFFKALETYEGTDLGKQEIYGAILDPEDAGIVKRKWFKMWPAKKPTPVLEYVIASYDPATSEKTVNDPTACEVWGVFEDTDKGTCIILLDAWDAHMSYPELRRKVINDYKEVVYGADNDFAKGRKADLILIEDKSAGISLIQELQQSGTPVRGYNPGKADKVQRLNIVAPLIAKGKAYVPENPEIPGEFADWAKRFIRQVCSFPESGGHDDYVDALSQALRVLRDSGWISLDPLPHRDYDYADDEMRKKRYNPYAV
jgi:predicted phage terminase large subunit-like protein